eukprot:1389685-Pleurochrysis_carterae.AAC.2
MSAAAVKLRDHILRSCRLQQRKAEAHAGKLDWLHPPKACVVCEGGESEGVKGGEDQEDVKKVERARRQNEGIRERT